MAEVVKVEVLEARSILRFNPRLLKDVWAQGAALLAGEDERLRVGPDELIQVEGEVLDDV